MDSLLFYKVYFALSMIGLVSLGWYLWRIQKNPSVDHHRVGRLLVLVASIGLAQALWSTFDEALSGDRTALLWALICLLNLGFALSGAIAVLVRSKQPAADSGKNY